MGLSIIFMGIQYQKYQGILRQALLHLVLPKTISSSLFSPIVSWASAAAVQMNKATAQLPILLRYATQQPNTLIPIAIGSCLAILIITILYNYLFNTLRHTYPKVKVTSAKVIWPTDTNDHGIIFRVRGTKPKDFTVSQAELHIVSTSLWNAIASMFGSTVVSAAKFTFYPAKLCPKFMDASAFASGSESFEVDIHLGTGHNGSPKVAHATLRNVFGQFSGYPHSDPTFTIMIQYTKRFGTYRGVLFELSNLQCSTLQNAEHVAQGGEVWYGKDS